MRLPLLHQISEIRTLSITTGLSSLSPSTFRQHRWLKEKQSMYTDQSLLIFLDLHTAEDVCVSTKHCLSLCRTQFSSLSLDTWLSIVSMYQKCSMNLMPSQCQAVKDGTSPTALATVVTNNPKPQFSSRGPHYLTIMKPPLNLPLKMAEWQETSVNAFVQSVHVSTQRISRLVAKRTVLIGENYMFRIISPKLLELFHTQTISQLWISAVKWLFST